jgi:hypothetical protein
MELMTMTLRCALGMELDKFRDDINPLARAITSTTWRWPAYQNTDRIQHQSVCNSHIQGWIVGTDYNGSYDNECVKI